ncbi:hypothetical protein SMY28_004226 [Cronobacter dublinensis]|nr:hypothetical protein [Cronobacter dublinensis]
MSGDQAGAPLEPFTAAYPAYGKGGVQQMHANKRKVYFAEIDILPEE